MPSRAPSVFDVANLFLRWADKNDDVITNMKIQKLVYYAQGFHLAVFGSPLFTNNIKAWSHGPVVGELYGQYKGCGSGALPPPGEDWEPADCFTSEQVDLMADVNNVYGQYAAWALRDMTHEEPPWRDNYDEDKRGIVIPVEHMLAFFVTRIQG